MNNFNSEPTPSGTPMNLELAAGLIDPHLINEIQEREDFFNELKTVFGEETINILKKIWLSDVRLAFFSGTAAQVDDATLAPTIKNVITDNLE